MIPWINIAILIVASIIFTVFYVKSVKPATLERKIGASAYKKCTTYRLVASYGMGIVFINYILYFFFPLPINFPVVFPWSWWVSALIALFLAVPSLFLMTKGVKDAGEETMTPKREHKMYGGIYEKIRHPQALGEFPLWWVIAFLVHSPFLVILSFAYVPIWYYFCIAEENDLKIRYGKAYEEYCNRVGFWIPK